MESIALGTYESPAILETFSALEVMGSAEGSIGNGSQVASISVAV